MIAEVTIGVLIVLLGIAIGLAVFYRRAFWRDVAEKKEVLKELQELKYPNKQRVFHGGGQTYLQALLFAWDLLTKVWGPDAHAEVTRVLVKRNPTCSDGIQFTVTLTHKFESELN